MKLKRRTTNSERLSKSAKRRDCNLTDKHFLDLQPWSFWNWNKRSGHKWSRNLDKCLISVNNHQEDTTFAWFYWRLRCEEDLIFEASALWADAFYKSICPSVCLSVCLCVRLFTFEVPFKRLFAPPLPEVGCPIFLEIRNPWGKVMERNGLRVEHFCLKMV